jgi:SAM-dependent methyltransferase
MIALARERCLQEPVVGQRVRFVEGRLPGAAIPDLAYAAIISNSLLHHLHDPAVLWDAVTRYASPGTHIYIVDLLRPADTVAARGLVDAYASGEPEILRRDFYNSLCAAFEPQEVEAQLAAAHLDELSVEVISDRHLMVHGSRR